VRRELWILSNVIRRSDFKIKIPLCLLHNAHSAHYLKLEKELRESIFSVKADEFMSYHFHVFDMSLWLAVNFNISHIKYTLTVLGWRRVTIRPKNGVFWDVTPCGSCKNRRFGELSASIIRVTRIGKLGTTLALSSNRVGSYGNSQATNTANSAGKSQRVPTLDKKRRHSFMPNKREA
jgi:hypothetical protein